MKRLTQAWYVSLLRGVFALLLGFSLIFIAEKTVGNLIQFIGMFWLMAGITSVALSRSRGEETRWSLVAGVLGIITGLVAIGRPFAETVLAQELVISMIGVASIVTGLLHILGGFLTNPEHGTHWAQGNRLLGVIEAVLGLIALSHPYAAPKAGYWVATAWALGAAALLIIQALRQRVYAGAARRPGRDRPTQSCDSTRYLGKRRTVYSSTGMYKYITELGAVGSNASSYSSSSGPSAWR